MDWYNHERRRNAVGFVRVEDIDALHQELTEKKHAYAKPVVQDLRWGPHDGSGRPVSEPDSVL